TFPVENGAPVILDPRVPRNGLEIGVKLAQPGPVAISPHDAIEWTAQLAEAGAAPFRNGPTRGRNARNAVWALVNDGTAPADAETIDGIALMLAMAERVARKYGPRVVAMVRSTAQAIADLAEESLAHMQRNLAIEIGGTRLEAPPWLSGLPPGAGRGGVGIG